MDYLINKLRIPYQGEASVRVVLEEKWSVHNINSSTVNMIDFRSNTLLMSDTTLNIRLS